MRSQSLEFLDNVLRESVRQPVMAVFDDLELEQRMNVAVELFSLPVATRTATLEALLEDTQDGDESATWLAAAAIETVRSERLLPLYPTLQRMAVAAIDPLLVETAAWAIEHEDLHRSAAES